jgi:PAS domain S-box-containing protein
MHEGPSGDKNHAEDSSQPADKLTGENLDQKSLAEKLQLIQFSLDNAMEGIVWISRNGRIIYVNHTECQRLGYSREEMLEKSVFDIDPSITPEAWAANWQTLKKAGDTTLETRHRTRTGEFIPVEISNKHIELGENEFAFSFSRDITERKLVQEALEKRLVALTRPLEDSGGITFEELFSLEDIQQLQDQFAAATGVASIITRTDGSPITRPSKFCRLCSNIIRGTEKGRENCYKSDAALGRVNTDGPIIQPCMSSGLWDAGASITVGGRHIANWLIGQVRDKTQTDEIMAAYAREIGADEEAFLNAFHEVSAMSKERFEAVAQVLFTLAKQLSNTAYQNVQQARFITERDRAEKEKESLQAQFQQAQKLESVGRLAGGVAHDLNNLLAPILGYSEMLLDDLESGDPQWDSLQSIMDAGIRARDIVRQLLAFSRKQTMEFKPVNLNDMLARFEKLLRRTIREDITINIIPAPTLSHVMGDIGQLEQMVMNLVVNAQDAMPDGGLLSIETGMMTLEDGDAAIRRDLAEGSYILFAVSDTGSGIDPETRKHIFEPFFSTKGDMGTGLGLATVYGIVKQHGGSIWVYSEIGSGTTFKVYLPASEKGGTPEKSQEPGEAIPGGFETILLVEDNDQVRRMTGSILKKRGYHILQAENGKKALSLLNRHGTPVHLLLTDVVMPEMNGKDLYIEASKIQPDIRVLYMSGYTDDVIAHRGVLDQDIDFIQKPFSVRGLTTKVRDVLDAPYQPRTR